jgi:hypothetical protein
MSDTLRTTIISGIFALLGVIGGGAITGWSQVQLAKQKFNSDLVLKALESNSAEERLKTLNLLVETNLLQDTNIQQGVKNYAKANQNNPSGIPQVSATSTVDDLSKPLKFAKSKEQEGYKELFEGNFEAAQQAFEAAEDTVKGYHNAYELAGLLRKRIDDLKDPNKRKEVFQNIIKQYYGYATPEQLKKLRELAQ